MGAVVVFTCSNTKRPNVTVCPQKSAAAPTFLPSFSSPHLPAHWTQTGPLLVRAAASEVGERIRSWWVRSDGTTDQWGISGPAGRGGASPLCDQGVDEDMVVNVWLVNFSGSKCGSCPHKHDRERLDFKRKGNTFAFMGETLTCRAAGELPACCRCREQSHGQRQHQLLFAEQSAPQPEAWNLHRAKF